eukprot:jgi/Hompol1/888/HPOL_002592-RA
MTPINNAVGLEASVTSIDNFRDATAGLVGQDGRLMKAGILFRSARPDDASDADLELVVNSVQTIIDLREPIERKRDSSRLVVQAEVNGKLLRPIDLVGAIRFSIFKSMSFIWQFVAILYWLTGQRQQFVTTVGRHSVLGKQGLLGLYKSLLDGAQEGIKSIMLQCADPLSFPILVHCTAGKDRTGLTIALLQLLAGVSKQDVIKQYARSNLLLEKRAAKLLADVRRLGFNEEFAGCPPTAMENTIAYIEQRYGSVSLYLVSIGVSLETQNLIRSNLLQNPSSKL